MSIAHSGDSRLTEDDLTPYMQWEFQKAFEVRERPRASREDFAAGFIAALLALRSRSSFKPGRME